MRRGPRGAEGRASSRLLLVLRPAPGTRASAGAGGGYVDSRIYNVERTRNKAIFLTFGTFFRALRNQACRYSPLLLAVILLSMAAFIGYDYFRTPPQGDMWRGHWAGCGNFHTLIDAADRNKLDYLSLDITDKETGQLFVSGELILSADTYKKLRPNDDWSATVSLGELRSPRAFVGMDQYIDVDMQKGERRWGNAMVFRVKETRLHASGWPRDFPFDTYRAGFVPSLKMSGSRDSNWTTVPLDTIITNVRLSDSMTVNKAVAWSDYVDNVALTAAERNKAYGEDECALIVRRAPWYRTMVVLLIVLLCIPAAYLVFRPDDNPGVDLIAVILGVATIRQFLLGNLVDWTLYSIDMVFVLVTVITAAIPLWHIYRRHDVPRAGDPGS